MQVSTILRAGSVFAGLAGAVTAQAQHPAASPENWGLSHPQYLRQSFSSAPYSNQLCAPNDSVLYIGSGATGRRLLRTLDRGLTWEAPSPVAQPPGQLRFFSTL